MRLRVRDLTPQFVWTPARAWLGAALLVLLAVRPAGADPVDDWISQLETGERAARIEAVQALGQSADARALAALVVLLTRPIDDAEEREELWLVEARALKRLAGSFDLDDVVLARLQELAETEATVTAVDTGFDVPTVVPRYAFARAARDAVQFAQRRRADDVLGRRLAALAPDEQIEVLADLAWTPRPSDPPLVWVPAREELERRGAAGLDALIARIPDADRAGLLAMLEYLEAACSAVPDERCTQAALSLVDSGDRAVWQDALRRLPGIRGGAPARDLIGRVESRGVLNDEFTRLVLHTLGQLRDPRAVPFLGGQLAHRERAVRRAAGLALVKLGPAGVDALIDAASSGDERVRDAAVTPLGLHRDERSERALREYLRAHPGDERAEWVRQQLEPE